MSSFSGQAGVRLRRPAPRRDEGIGSPSGRNVEASCTFEELHGEPTPVPPHFSPSSASPLARVFQRLKAGTSCNNNDYMGVS